MYYLPKSPVKAPRKPFAPELSSILSTSPANASLKDCFPPPLKLNVGTPSDSQARELQIAGADTSDRSMLYYGAAATRKSQERFRSFCQYGEHRHYRDSGISLDRAPAWFDRSIRNGQIETSKSERKAGGILYPRRAEIDRASRFVGSA